MNTLPYQEGSWFSVPLRNGGYAVGLVARCSEEGKVILAYFFGPKRLIGVSLNEVERLTPTEAVKALRVGDLGLMNGEWPIIGRSNNWQRNTWPMPRFIRRDDLSRRAWYSYYSEDNPAELLKDEPAAWEASGLDRDSVLGAGAAEIVLTKLLP